MAHCVGPAGRIVACEVDARLAEEARENLASMPWVEVRHDDASAPLGERFDAILVNAGVTHPLDTWLDALTPDGRMVLPLTVRMGPTIGKGLVMALTAAPGGDLKARVLTVVAIYTAEGVRDETLSGAIGTAMMAGPIKWRRSRGSGATRTTAGPSCWLHGSTFCMSSG